MNRAPEQVRKVIHIDTYHSAQAATMRHQTVGPVGWDDMIAWLGQEVLGERQAVETVKQPESKPVVSLTQPRPKLPAIVEADLPQLLNELGA